MALSRWDPVRDLDSLQGEMNRLFDRFFERRDGDGGSTRRWTPAMDLVETHDSLVLRADLPDGVDAEKIAAAFNDGVLEVRVPKPEETQPTRVEIGKGSVEGSGTEA